jgi:SAM-dependent methyltransferase
MNARDLQRYAQDYDATYEVEVHLVRARRRRALETVGATPDPVVIEIGCGRESAIVDAPPVRAWHVVEPSPAFALRARALADRFPGLRVHQQTLEQGAIALRDVRPDVVLVSALLHEVADDERFLSALRVLCGPHTRVHIDVPNALSLHRQMAVAMGLLATPYAETTRARVLQQHRTYDIAQLQRTLTRHGFAIERTGSYYLKPFSHAQLADALRAGIITDAYLRACDDLSAVAPALGAEIFAVARLSEEVP